MKLQLSLNKRRSLYYEDFRKPNYNQQREVSMQRAWPRLMVQQAVIEYYYGISTKIIRLRLIWAKVSNN